MVTLSDEPKNDDFENRWDSETLMNLTTETLGSDISDSGSIIEQTLSNKISLVKSILSNQWAELEFES